LAFFRDETQFRNVRLVELDNGDFACSVTRLLVFSTHRLAILQRLRTSRDNVLAAVAAKGVKEITYHRDYAARWLVTLACGTEQSRRRVEEALITVWPYVAELFTAHPVERRIAGSGVGVDPSTVRDEFDSVITQVFHAAELPQPAVAPAPHGGGHRDGDHTDAMAAFVGEMQSLAREHTMGVW